MNQFTTIEKLDTAILYCLELSSSVSVLLLTFGLIASMANVLTKGSVLTNSSVMQQVWAWTQCIAIDASVAGTIIRAFRYHSEGEKLKTWLYGILSVFLLFVAAIVSNIEAIQQTLNLSLDSAYTHVFVSIEVLTWIRSMSVVLLIVAHALRYVQLRKSQASAKKEEQQGAKEERIEITPELINALRLALTGVQVIEEAPAQPMQLSEQREETEYKEAQKEAGDPFVQALHELDTLLPEVSLDDITAVVSAYRNGTKKRDLIKTLHWSAAKYSSVVKPVLDTYDQLQQTA